MEEKIMTRHPQGKQGVNISKEKYETVRRAILKILTERETCSFQMLMEDVGREVGDDFEGSVSWYTVSVKLDLEARGIIERLPGKSPQQLRLTVTK